MTAESGKTKVVCGANSQDVEGLVGKKVSEARQGLVEVMNISEDAQALVQGNAVKDGYRIREGDSLEFVKQSGIKG